MATKSITLNLPETLYNQSQELIERGLFTDLEEIIRAGLRHVLVESALIENRIESVEPSDAERCTYYIQRIRQHISKAGGLFPDKTPTEVIELLRQTREQVYEEKYAAYFGHE